MAKLPKKHQCDEQSHQWWETQSEAGTKFKLCQRCGIYREEKKMTPSATKQRTMLDILGPIAEQKY